MRFQGVAYRAHNPRWSWSPLSGDGAKLHGGRFNPKGVAALYLSLDWPTAVVEASQGFAFRFPPLTLVSYDVDCADIADLTSGDERGRLAITRRDLACVWKLLAETGKPVPSWVIAQRLIDAGFAGIIVPSFATGADRHAQNLVLWRWADVSPHKVTIIDPDGRLPRGDASWRR